VLFCDLVGFTPFSEKRDAEEVREVLSGYFDLARSIVGRYGGIVEKFIGDAVMAVWGAPVAKEDDAERAVRAGLELISAVVAYGSEHQTDLQVRVGVVTGGVATTETPEEGLVIGDRVNTAARIQSAAPPGCCYVDETTRAATAAAIAYVDAGEHSLKGKAEPIRLFQATRVVAAVAGSQRSGVLEAPFIGRDSELRLVKEHFHTTAERNSARLVLVSGVAGVGKSRLRLGVLPVHRRPCRNRGPEVSASPTKRSGWPFPLRSRRLSTPATPMRRIGSPPCWRRAHEARSLRSCGRR
jgi:class 3 adenylate cyclase